MAHADLTPTVRRLLEARRRGNDTDFARALEELAQALGEDAPPGEMVAVPRATLRRLVAAFDVCQTPPDVRCRDLWSAAQALTVVAGLLDAAGGIDTGGEIEYNRGS